LSPGRLGFNHSAIILIEFPGFCEQQFYVAGRAPEICSEHVECDHTTYCELSGTCQVWNYTEGERCFIQNCYENTTCQAGMCTGTDICSTTGTSSAETTGTTGSTTGLLQLTGTTSALTVTVTTAASITDIGSSESTSYAIYIGIGAAAGGILLGVVLIVAFLFIRRRRRQRAVHPEEPSTSSSKYVSMNDSKDGNDSTSHYQEMKGREDSQPSFQKSEPEPVKLTTLTKSWEVNFNELEMKETLGEGAYGTVHKAIYRHQQVAVKQLKNKSLPQTEVALQQIILADSLQVGQFCERRAGDAES
jgi:hypothetical protein